MVAVFSRQLQAVTVTGRNDTGSAITVSQVCLLNVPSPSPKSYLPYASRGLNHWGL